MTQKRSERMELIRESARIGVTLIVLCGGGWFVATNPDSGIQKTAFTLIGAVVGYWMK